MHTLHMIGNAHLDPVWLWSWQEGFAEIKATFRSALDRIKHHPGFIFTCACACYYEWIEQNEPEMFEEIKAAVQSDRWVIVGGMWIQPDMNTPSGESMVRQLLYSQRYFESRFGRKVTTGYNVDTFGHNAMLPQILKKAGIDSYVWMRPSVEENPDIPEGPMIWEAPDGSRVTAFRIKYEYTCKSNVPAKIEKLAAESQKLNVPLMVFYGVGNHGGGPTAENLRQIDEYQRAGKYGSQVIYSNPDAYFKTLDLAKLPVWKKELQHHASGCYSTCSASKMLHRNAENSLLTLEKFSVLSGALNGMTLNREAVQQAWKNLLFNEFHDVMGGCCIRESMQDAQMQLQETCSIAQREENRLLQHISWHVDTMHAANQIEDGKYSMTDGSACGVPVVVFNPHEFEATQAIRFHHHYSAGHYDNGDSFPVQLVRGSRTNGKSRFDTLAYVTIPAFGYRLIWLEEDHAEHAVQPCPVQIPILENQYIRAEFDEQTGKLIHLIDKKSGIDSIKAPSSIDVIDISNADTWAHNIFRFDRKCGEFDLLDWKITEDGPACRELTVRLTYGKSEIVQQYRLYPDAKQLDVHCYLHLHEKHKLIRVCISTPYRNEYSEIPYGTIRRNACGNEEHCQRWFAMEDEKAGLAVLNNGKYSYSAQNGELRLTIANTSVYADHYGQAYRDDSCRFMDQGEQEFCYALKPYTGSWSNHSIHRDAALLNMPLRYVMESYHAGNLPAEYSGLFVDQNNAEMGAVKASEDGKGTIIRIVEKTGKHQMVRLNMPALQRNEQIPLIPFEIKTLLIPADPALPIKETPITV